MSNFSFCLATFYFLRRHELYQLSPQTADQISNFALIAVSQQQLTGNNMHKSFNIME